VVKTTGYEYVAICSFNCPNRPSSVGFCSGVDSFPLHRCCFLGKYFDEISQDTGRYCFGVNDTLKALEMGAVDILIVWENLEVTRYVLRDHSADSKLAL